MANSCFAKFSFSFKAEVYTEVLGGCEKPSVLVTSPGSPDVHSRRRPARYNHHNANVSGRIQVGSQQLHILLKISSQDFFFMTNVLQVQNVL